MALIEIKDRMAVSFEKLRPATVLYKENLENFKNEIAQALLDANVPETLVIEIKASIQKTIDAMDAPGDLRKTISEEISRILDPRRSEKIVMFIGLQGFGKSYVCARYARYQKERGFKLGIVCGDTFAKDAYEFIKEEVCTKDVSVYKSYQTDPAKIAIQGIANLKKAECDFIVVDTNGCHAECSTLFKEMQELANELDPDRVIFVINGSVGKDAFEQARAFRESFPKNGVAYVTKTATDQKSLGALTAVAAAQCPMIVYTKGEKGEEFKELEPDALARLLMPENQDHEREDTTPVFAYTFRKMKTYFEKICERKVLRGRKPLIDIPTMKLYIKIMNNMTSEELDKSSLSYERLVQISLESEVTMIQARNMMTTHQQMANAWMKMDTRMQKLAKMMMGIK